MGYDWKANTVFRIMKKVLSNKQKVRIHELYCKTIWKMLYPNLYMHSSDIMMPCEKGIQGRQAHQYGVIAKVLDTERWMKGELPQYCFYGEKGDQREINKYVEFLERIKRNGYDSRLSCVWFKIDPCFRMVDGNHRMGYLLARQDNFFVPVGIEGPLSKRPYYENGAKFFETMEYSAEDIQTILSRYQEYFDLARKELTAVVNSEVYLKHSDDIRQWIGEVGILNHEQSIAIKRIKQFKKLTGLRNGNYYALTVTIDSNRLHYRHRRLYSESVSAFSSVMKAHFGKKWGYMCPTIGESIGLENTFLDDGANLTV